MNRKRYAIARRTPDSRRGFTLVEVLLVIAIIGVLATVLVVTIGGTREGANTRIADIQVKKVAGKIEQYANDLGAYPSESEGGLNALVSRPNFSDETTSEKWLGPYLQQADLMDPWNNPLNYEALQAGTESAPGVRFRLWSNGPDRQSNTADDITYGETETAGT